MRRKAVAKLCEWPTSRSVSDCDSSRYIRSNDQYAARRLVVVKDELPKGAEGLTDHSHASPSHDGAARTGLGTGEVGGWLYFSHRAGIEWFANLKSSQKGKHSKLKTSFEMRRALILEVSKYSVDPRILGSRVLSRMSW